MLQAPFRPLKTSSAFLWALWACNKPLNIPEEPVCFRGKLSFLTALQTAIPSDPTMRLWLLIVLVIIGLVVILAVGFLFAFHIAAFTSVVVYFFTGGDLFLTAVTFFGAALISAIVGRIRNRHAPSRARARGLKAMFS
jgi:polyferredoxin